MIQDFLIQKRNKRFLFKSVHVLRPIYIYNFEGFTSDHKVYHYNIVVSVVKLE